MGARFALLSSDEKSDTGYVIAEAIRCGTGTLVLPLVTCTWMFFPCMCILIASAPQRAAEDQVKRADQKTSLNFLVQKHLY